MYLKFGNDSAMRLKKVVKMTEEELRKLDENSVRKFFNKDCASCAFCYNSSHGSKITRGDGKHVNNAGLMSDFQYILGNNVILMGSYNCYYYQFKGIRLKDLLGRKKCSKYLKRKDGEDRVIEGIHLEREEIESQKQKKEIEKRYEEEKLRADKKDKLIIWIAIISCGASIIFSILDYLGDEKWQNKQLTALEQIQSNTKSSKND